MPADLQKITQNKERILSLIRLKGPSLPVHIARTISMEPLFASAFLSELFAEGKIKISHMRVGSSPLYFLQGQENLLENFIEYLNQREKEAFFLLKKSKILEDEKQSPVVRVALRAIKDFAVPIRVRLNGNVITIWKYFTIPDSDIESILKGEMNLGGYEQKEVQELEKRKQEESEFNKHTENKHIPASILKETEKLFPPNKIQESLTKIQENISNIKVAEEKDTKEIIKKIETKEEPLETKEKILEKDKTKKKKEKITESAFTKKLKDYLSSKEIEILSIVEEKKKEFYAKVRVDTIFGKQEYYLVAKDKKKISEIDLALALQSAQGERMLALIIAPGELDKKAQENIKTWKNLVKFEKVKL